MSNGGKRTKRRNEVKSHWISQIESPVPEGGPRAITSISPSSIKANLVGAIKKGEGRAGQGLRPYISGIKTVGHSPLGGNLRQKSRNDGRNSFPPQRQKTRRCWCGGEKDSSQKRQERDRR